MPQFTAPLPQSALPTDLDMESAPPTNILGGGAVAALNQFMTGPSAVGLKFLQEGLTAEMNPGKFLTTEEVEKSPYKIPGVSYPNGISQNVLKLKHNRLKNEQRTANILNNMPPGFLSWTSRNVGSLIGVAGTFTIDPIGSGIAKTTTSLTTRLAPWLLSKIEGRMLTFAARAAIGFPETAIIGGPLSLAQYGNERDLGQDHGVLSIFANMATFGMLGGFIRLGFGFDRSVVKPEEHLRAQDAAINHLMNGKPAYVEPIIKNGAYQMAKESQQFLKRSGDMLEEIPTLIEKVDDEIKVKQTQLSKKFKGRARAEEVMDIEPGNEFVQRLDRMRIKPSELFTDEEKELSRKFISPTLSAKEPTILKKIFDITEKSSIRRSPKEQQLLDDFIGTKEKEVTLKEITDLTNKRAEITDRMKETKNESLKTKLKFKISDFNDRIKKNSIHLENIKKIDRLEKDNVETFELRGALKELEVRKQSLQSTLDANKIYSQNINTNQSPVTENELRSNTEWINDWRSDFPYSPQETKIFREDVATIPENIQFDSESVFNDLKDLRDAGELTSKAEDFLDEVEKDDEAFESISSSLRAFFDCLLKRGE